MCDLYLKQMTPTSYATSHAIFLLMLNNNIIQHDVLLLPTQGYRINTLITFVTPINIW